MCKVKAETEVNKVSRVVEEKISVTCNIYSKKGHMACPRKNNVSIHSSQVLRG